MDCGNHPNSFYNRREFLTNFGAGFGNVVKEIIS